jgi:protein-disulfide isomerase
MRCAMQWCRRGFGYVRSAVDLLAALAVIVIGVVVVKSHVMPSQAQAAIGNPQKRPPRGDSLPLPFKPIALTGMFVEGSSSAAVALIEFSDFQCPFCGQFARDTLPELRHSYVESGDVTFAFAPLPLASIHPLATKAAETAVCANEQADFWPTHDKLFASPTELSAEMLAALAPGDPTARREWDDCLRTRASKAVSSMVSFAHTLGITSTPTFLVGLRQRDGLVDVRHRISGAVSAAEIGAAIRPLLRSVTRSGLRSASNGA